jgi:hypothetical protein
MSQKIPLFKIDTFNDYSIDYRTFHTLDRKTRLERYDFGNRLDGFVVDTNHKNGLEVHILDSKGYVQIFNKASKKFITALSGRPRQLKEYYEKLGLDIPQAVHQAIKIAMFRNDKLNYNNI